MLRALVDFIDKPYIKWALPIPVLLLMAPVLWRFFRVTWRELEDDALTYRQALRDRGVIDYRPAVAMIMGVFLLTVQEYFGRYSFWDANLMPWLRQRADGDDATLSHLATYGELYGRVYWGGMRLVTYLSPLLVWRLFFAGDSVLDMGLRTRGFREHAWIYAFCVVVMIPLMYITARQPDFGHYYPIYDQAGRSWLDFFVWELAYLGQFLGLEIFFRGWWIRACRALGIGAIFSMVVPYAMIHFGKPYHEVSAAFIAGTLLGSLSMRTRNIWSGLLVHGTVAVLMDIMSLSRKNQLPTLTMPGSERRLLFPYWHHMIWLLWVLALAVVLWQVRRKWPEIRAALRREPASAG